MNIHAVCSGQSRVSGFAFRRPKTPSSSFSPITLHYHCYILKDQPNLNLNLNLKQRHQPHLSCHAIPPRNDELPVHGVSEVIVGILGGGQLGRMLCQAASKMAIKVMVLDPQENCPASSLSYYHMVGSYDDSAIVEEFVKRCGVLTFEIEHVDVATLEKLEQQGVDCEPKASTIRIIKDKYLQKVHFSQHDIPLPEFMQMPKGVPVATVAINNATNAGLLAVRMLGVANNDLLSKMSQYQEDQKETVLRKGDKLENFGWESYLNNNSTQLKPLIW